jgi:sugar phosphate isomerase/epimerase
MQPIVRKVRELGYRGLVELEHLWSAPDLEIKRRGIDWLRQGDATLA